MLFVHDDWRITPKLTLNVGLRWEYEDAITERFNRSFAVVLAYNLRVRLNQNPKQISDLGPHGHPLATVPEQSGYRLKLLRAELILPFAAHITVYQPKDS